MSNMNPTIEQSKVSVSPVEGIIPVPSAEQEQTQPVAAVSEENVPPVLEKTLPDTRLETNGEQSGTYIPSAGPELQPSGTNSLSNSAIQAILDKIANKEPQLN